MSILNNKIDNEIPRIGKYIFMISVINFFIILPTALGESVTIENITIVQPDKGNDSLMESIIPLIGVLLGGIIAFGTSIYLGWQKEAAVLKTKQQQLYCRLFGLKFLLAQLYVSLNQHYIYYKSHKITKNQSWCENKEYESDEIKKHTKEYNELVLEIAKINQRMFEAVSIIPILFRNTPTFDDSISKLKKLDESFKNQRDQFGKDLKESCSSSASVEDWKTRALVKVNTLKDNEIEATFKGLLGDLEKEIMGRKH